MARVLAIETSCDETAAAIVSGPNDKKIMSNIVKSQAQYHSLFGVGARTHTTELVMPSTTAGTLSAAGKKLLVFFPSHRPSRYFIEWVVKVPFNLSNPIRIGQRLTTL